jgi:carbon monoxide dehydrogenase subunit G
MKIEGSYTYPADPVVVWSVVSEPGMAARILPGCQVLEPLDSRHYRAVLSQRVGKVIEQLAVALALTEVTPNQALEFQAGVNSLSGSMKVNGRISLAQPELGCTELSYEAEVTEDQFIGVSSRMLTTTMRAFARRSLEALDRQLAVRTRVYSTTVQPEEPASTAALDDRLATLRHIVAAIVLILAFVLMGRGIKRRRGRQEARLDLPDLSYADPGQPGLSPERSAT